MIFIKKTRWASVKTSKAIRCRQTNPRIIESNKKAKARNKDIKIHEEGNTRMETQGRRMTWQTKKGAQGLNAPGRAG